MLIADFISVIVVEKVWDKGYKQTLIYTIENTRLNVYIMRLLVGALDSYWVGGAVNFIRSGMLIANFDFIKGDYTLLLSNFVLNVTFKHIH